METDKWVSFRRLEYIMMNDLKDPKKKTTTENQAKDGNQTKSCPIAEYIEISDTDFTEESCELLVGWSHSGWNNHGGGRSNW